MKSIPVFHSSCSVSTRHRLNDLVESEFAAELELCRANPDMLRQYLDMKRAGHRVGFISDTYWDSDRLARLLRACRPGLTWDFLYASCDHGSGKSEALFAKYLSEQGIDASASFHVGDNDKADIRGAKRHGIRPRYYPQATPQLASKFQRETALLELLCAGAPSRLDHGARTLRRMVAARNAEKSPAFHLGMTVLGPVMTAFDAFIARRCAEAARPRPEGRPRLPRPRRLPAAPDLAGPARRHIGLSRDQPARQPDRLGRYACSR